MENIAIRREAKANGIPFWRICERLNISEPTFTRLMRKPLTTEKEAQIRNIIIELAKES
jgi:orotate phosphoribosyltransferase-like protein